MNNENTTTPAATTKDQTELLETWAVENGIINPVTAAPQPDVTTTIPMIAAATITVTPPLVPVKLSIRRPGDLLKMQFDDSDILLGDRVLAKSQFLVIAGQAGIGKSRFALQLAVDSILNRDFLKLPIKNGGGKWLMLQTENSNRRLNKDLQRLKESLTEEQWNTVHDNLHIHTLEEQHDYILTLGDQVNFSRIEQAILEVEPDVVVFDPLYAFGTGDLNSDVDMAESCRKLQELALKGNSQRALIVLHHSLTGKQGAIRVMGYDRASFGRNSKVLYAWTRAQINLAPGSADNNDTIVVVCAKNNNGKSFDPFAAKLNTKTMLYEVDHMFDFKKWQDGVRGKGTQAKLIADDAIAALLKDNPMKKGRLAKAIMDETGCAKTAAYKAIKEADQIAIYQDKTDKLFKLM